MQKKFWRGRRERASGKESVSKRRKILEYLATIAVKQGLDASEFFNCIVKAWSQEKSECKQVSVRCRGRTEESAIFLFSVDHEVLAQFPIPTRILRGKNDLESYTSMVYVKTSPLEGAADQRIKDLKAGMKKVNLKAKVLEIPKPNMVYTRFGTEAYVTNVLVGDETGTIRMNLWNQQINVVSEGDMIKIDNGIVTSFRGERQLRIGKHGRIRVIQHV